MLDSTNPERHVTLNQRFDTTLYAFKGRDPRRAVHAVEQHLTHSLEHVTSQLQLDQPRATWIGAWLWRRLGVVKGRASRPAQAAASTGLDKFLRKRAHEIDDERCRPTLGLSGSCPPDATLRSQVDAPAAATAVAEPPPVSSRTTTLMSMSAPQSQLSRLAHVYLRFLLLLRPPRVSAILSTAFLTELLAWSPRPSFFRRLSPVSAPAASFTRPLTLSMLLSVMKPPDLVGHERPNGR
jgi:hypothetical protein